MTKKEISEKTREYDEIGSDTPKKTYLFEHDNLFFEGCTCNNKVDVRIKGSNVGLLLKGFADKDSFVDIVHDFLSNRV